MITKIDLAEKMGISRNWLNVLIRKAGFSLGCEKELTDEQADRVISLRDMAVNAKKDLAKKKYEKIDGLITLSQLSDETGINYKTLYMRIRKNNISPHKIIKSVAYYKQDSLLSIYDTEQNQQKTYSAQDIADILGFSVSRIQILAKDTNCGYIKTKTRLKLYSRDTYLFIKNKLKEPVDWNNSKDKVFDIAEEQLKVRNSPYFEFFSKDFRKIA